MTMDDVKAYMYTLDERLDSIILKTEEHRKADEKGLQMQ